jgi:hypothetical protein
MVRTPFPLRSLLETYGRSFLESTPLNAPVAIKFDGCRVVNSKAACIAKVRCHVIVSYLYAGMIHNAVKSPAILLRVRSIAGDKSPNTICKPYSVPSSSERAL